MPIRSTILLLGIILITAAPADAQTKRRVFVLHSGMHVVLAPKDKDHAARTLKEILQNRGIAARDLVALDSPFPTASWEEMVPKQGLVIYFESTDPKSRISQDAYLRLHKALQAQGVAQNDELVWIGHSAGGQIGMTMAHLAHNLSQYPDLAKKAKPYRFDIVITLGSAIGANPTPKEVKLRHYWSSGDTMVYFLSEHGDLVSKSMKSKVRFAPWHDVGPNVKLRVFPGIEHPNWYEDDKVLACVFREFDSAYCPAWRRTNADANRGIGLSQLMARSLEAELRISLEDDRH
ncbi:MAG: hypothetical protein HYR84_10155 [Planctomycetes bacterium]|nr:hypothetical protein [Planctomycetota bacterium]